MTLYLGVIIVAGAILVARPLFLISFSAQFLPSVTPFKILIVGFFVRSIGKTLEPYLIGTNRPGTTSTAVAVGMGVNLICLKLLFVPYGLAGAAWALTMNYLCSTAILLFAFSRHSAIPPGTVFRLTAEDFRIASSALSRLRGR